MDLKKRLLDNLSAVTEGVLLLAVFGLVFLTMSQSPTRYVITVSFFVTVAMFVYLTVRTRLRIKKAIRLMTEALSVIPDDLRNKCYDDMPEDTQPFFETLTRVKTQLGKREQARKELLEIANAVALNMEFDKLLRDLMPKLNEATRSNCSAYYTVNTSSKKLEIKHSVGFSKNIYGQFDMSLGEGFVGCTANSRQTTIYRDIPDDTIYYIRSFLGKIKPRNLMVVPVLFQDELAGVMVCASIYEYTHEDREMVELIKYYLGVATSNGVQYEKTKRLTNELTFQNKLIQDQYEDMRRRLNEKTWQLNNLINIVSDRCMYTLNQNGVVLLWNESAERMYGLSAAEAVGKPIEKICTMLDWPSLTDALRGALETGTYSADIYRLDVDGVRHSYKMTLTVMHNDNREPIGFLNQITETPPTDA